MLPEIWIVTDIIFCTILGHFLPFTPLLTPNIKIWKKCTKHPFSHVHYKWRSYDVWFVRYKARQSEFFIILDHFLPSDPPNNLKNQNFEKMKKTPGDIILLQLSITNNNHVIYSSLDMECNRQNILSFWAIFCPFTPYQFEKPTFKKNQMRYNHFTHVYQKMSDYV